MRKTQRMDVLTVVLITWPIASIIAAILWRLALQGWKDEQERAQELARDMYSQNLQSRRDES
jgi:membrane protein implicated in regulation of membrane protease activity